MNHRFVAMAAAVLISLVATASAYAQGSSTASISSVVVDAGGGVIDDGIWDLHLGPVRLGRFDERRHRIEPAGVWRAR